MVFRTLSWCRFTDLEPDGLVDSSCGVGSAPFSRDSPRLGVGDVVLSMGLSPLFSSGISTGEERRGGIRRIPPDVCHPRAYPSGCDFCGTRAHHAPQAVVKTSALAPCAGTLGAFLMALGFPGVRDRGDESGNHISGHGLSQFRRYYVG